MYKGKGGEMKFSKLAVGIKNRWREIGVGLAAMSILSIVMMFGRKEVSNFALGNLENKSNIVPIAIIGGGSAGLTAAIYGARSGFHTIVFEGDEDECQLGMISTIENWPGILKSSGMEILEKLQQQADKFGAIRIPVSIQEIDFGEHPFVLTTQDGERIHALTVIIATGSKLKRLGIKGEDEYWGKGVATCSKCDAPLTKNKTVIILGGNDHAIEYALQIAPYTQDITIMFKENKLQATAHKCKMLEEHPYVKIVGQKQLEEIMGDGKNVTGIRVRDLSTNQIENIKIDWLFLAALGSAPNTSVFEGKVALGPKGHVLLPDRSQKTNVPGVFAAGTASDARYKQASVASGDGARAALDASSLLWGFGTELEKVARNQLYRAVNI